MAADVCCEKVHGRSVSCSEEHAVEDNRRGISLPRRSSLMSKDKPRVKKTVSFTCSDAERHVSNAADCIRYMQNGCELKKVRSSRLISRFFFLSDDMRELRWMPSSKKYDRARVLMESVREVQHGGHDPANSKLLQEQDVDAQEECMFSVVHGNKFESLALLARTPDEANIWVAGLTYLLAQEQTREAENENDVDHLLRDRWLAEVFQEADESNQGLLPEFEVVSMIRKLNPTIGLVHLRQRIRELYMMRQSSPVLTADFKGLLTCEEFIGLYKDVASRREVYFLLAKYSGNDDYLTADSFSLFLATEQSLLGVSREQCEQLIETYEPTIEGKKRCVLGIDGKLRAVWGPH